MKKLSRKEKLILRRLLLVILAAVICAIPIAVVNEQYFINQLGWQSVAFPVILATTMMLSMFLFERLT